MSTEARKTKRYLVYMEVDADLEDLHEDLCRGLLELDQDSLERLRTNTLDIQVAGTIDLSAG